MNTPIALPVINYLSEHFTLAEAIRSAKTKELGIDNTPSSEEFAVMQKTAVRMEKVRNVLQNKPITVTSWIRVPKLNAVISKSKTSQHMFGEAVDFICPKFGSPLEICRIIIAASDLIRFDQLILEHTWVHISFAIRTGKPRNQVLSLIKNNKYAIGLTDINGKPYK